MSTVSVYLFASLTLFEHFRVAKSVVLLSSGNTPQDAFDVDTTFYFAHIVNFRNSVQSQFKTHYINKINSRSCSDFAGLKLKVSAMKGYFNTLW